MSNEEMPYLWAEDLVKVFGYPTIEALYKAIQRGTFPVMTYRLAGRIVADREVVKQFFRNRRAEGLRDLDEKMKRRLQRLQEAESSD